MKVALVSDAFPPMRTSAAVQVSDLARAMVRLGHEVTVIAPDASCSVPIERERQSDGVEIIRVRTPEAKDRNYAVRVLAEWRTPRIMRDRLRKSGALDGFDGVVWYSPSIFFEPLIRALKKAGGVPAYLILRDVFPRWALDVGVLRPGPVYEILQAIARGQYRQADVIGVQSEGNMRLFPLDRLRSGQTVEVLNNWLSPHSPVGKGLDLSETSLSGRKIIVYTGNMGVAQGMDVVLELAHRLERRKDIGFLFVGRGADAERLSAVVRARGLQNVVFHPEVDPERMPDILEQAVAGLVVLDPRHTTQNIPGKAVSYLWHGVPLLALVNPNSDLADMVRTHDVGLVFDVNQDVAAVENLVDCAGPGLADRCRATAAALFSAEGAARQIVTGLERQA